MGIVHWLIDSIAPILSVAALCLCENQSKTNNFNSLITSPVTSYADQIYSIHRSRTSAGFSLDIPLIMLLASILKYADTKSGQGYECGLTHLQDILLVRSAL